MDLAAYFAFLGNVLSVVIFLVIALIILGYYVYGKNEKQEE